MMEDTTTINIMTMTTITKIITITSMIITMTTIIMITTTIITMMMTMISTIPMTVMTMTTTIMITKTITTEIILNMNMKVPMETLLLLILRFLKNWVPIQALLRSEQQISVKGTVSLICDGTRYVL